MTRHIVPPLTFDELLPGDEWESPARTVTEADVVNFAGLSGDFNPIHVDHESARAGSFGRPVAHGLLGLAIASGLGSQSPRVDTLAFLAILEWKFLTPIAFGDTIRVVSRVEAVQPRSHGRRGVVTWQRQLVNQRGETVQEGRTQTLVRGRRPVGTGEAGPEGKARRRAEPGQPTSCLLRSAVVFISEAHRMRYRTEILVPPDRYVCLQLPTYLPEGRAVVTVLIQEPVHPHSGTAAETDPDRQDIEWWDEFEDEEIGRQP